MRLHKMFVVCVAVVAAAPVAVQAGAATGAATHSRAPTRWTPRQRPKPLATRSARRIQDVLPCTVSGFVLNYSGSLRGRGVNTFRWIVHCADRQKLHRRHRDLHRLGRGRRLGHLLVGRPEHGHVDCDKGEVTSVSAIENLYSGTGTLAGMYGSIHRGPTRTPECWARSGPAAGGSRTCSAKGPTSAAGPSLGSPREGHQLRDRCVPPWYLWSAGGGWSGPVRSP